MKLLKGLITWTVLFFLLSLGLLSLAKKQNLIESVAYVNFSFVIGYLISYHFTKRKTYKRFPTSFVYMIITSIGVAICFFVHSGLTVSPDLLFVSVGCGIAGFFGYHIAFNEKNQVIYKTIKDLSEKIT